MMFFANVWPISQHLLEGYAIMKPGKRDIKVKIFITGRDLEELQKHTWSMAESFGLNDRIDNYREKRPIRLYAWDMECLFDVLRMALEDTKEYPPRGNYRTRGYTAAISETKTDM